MTSERERLLRLAAEVEPERRAELLARHSGDSLLNREVLDWLRYADEAEFDFDRAVGGLAASLPVQRELSPGDLVGGFRIVSPIGRGGMGAVYLAERIGGDIRQRVALKVLRADVCRPGWRERFLRERQLLATLHHPSIVHVIDAGQAGDGRPYLAMEYVQGSPLDRYAERIGVRERLKLFLHVCDAVSHAHRHLIIHRDLKPSNILVDAAGRPKLLDFGIAKPQLGAGEATETVERILTPDYASPEQLRGAEQTTATDVYSLGAVLHTMMTGTPPRRDRPPLHADVPRDLEHVIAKALRPEPEERYRSVDQLADDIRAVLERRPVDARRGDWWYRARVRLRRHWIPAVAAAAVVASLGGGLLAANRERRIAERRFNDVRQLANKLFSIDAEVAQLAGASKTRQVIVDTALRYLTRVSADVTVQPELALELATAYMRVARVQGVNISPNLGQTSAADATAANAQRLIESVLRAQPENRAALLRAGQIAHDRMLLAGDARRDADALEFARTARERLEQYLAAGAPRDRSDAQQAILALINVANRYMKGGQFDEAIGIARRAIEVARATNWAPQAGAAMMIVALAHRAKGDLAEALKAAQVSVRLLEPADGEASTGRFQAYGLALIREAQILGEPESVSLGRSNEALAMLQQALAIGEPLARRDPTDFQSQYRMFTIKTKMADVIRERRPEVALELYDDALRRLARAGANSGTPRNEARALAASVYPLLRLGRRAEARRRLEAAFERMSRVGEFPSAALRARAAYEADAGNLRRASAVFDELVRGTDAAAAGSDLEKAVELSGLYAAAARVQRRAGNRGSAKDLESRRLGLWRAWDSKLPGNGFVRGQLEAAAHGAGGR